MVASLAVISLIGCSGGTTTNARTPGWMAPGTEILAGLRVEPGSYLLGEAFPDTTDTSHPSQGRVNRGASQPWTALVAVDGDPGLVFDRYIDQFRRLGIVLRPTVTEGSCSSGPPGPARCALSKVHDGSDFRNGLIMWPIPRDGSTSDRAVITVTLTPQDSNESRPADLVSPSLPLDKSTIPPPENPPPPPAPQPPGMPIAPDFSVARRSVVVPGSSLVASATPSSAAGWKAVLRITGDPERVGAALAANPYQPILRSQQDLRGRKVLRWSWDGAGGDKLSITALPDDDGNWYALIDTYTDP